MLIARKVFTENRKVFTLPPLFNASVSHDHHDFINDFIIKTQHTLCIGIV